MINRLIVLGEQSVVTIVACKRGFKCGWGCRSVARSVLFARRADATRFARSQPITFPSRGASQPARGFRSHASRQPAPVFLSLPSVFSTSRNLHRSFSVINVPASMIPLFQQPRVETCCYLFAIHLSLSFSLCLSLCMGEKLRVLVRWSSLLNL